MFTVLKSLPILLMKHSHPIYFAALFAISFLACQGQKADDADVRKVPLTAPQGKSVAAFASGCFWCTEHIFEAVVGVDSAVSGYAGGNVPDPTYELVNTETTGHAETILVYYDPKLISYEELTNVFFTSHDPTTPNQQGPDKGSSYRSILFYNTPTEKSIAENAVQNFGKSFSRPIVTEIKKLSTFYRAEGYHQDYIHHNPKSPYVLGVSIPRYEKFKRTYKGKLKDNIQ
jgi:peptide-methionine (S)-S-oxide reductase